MFGKPFREFGVRGVLRLAGDVLATKLTMPNARIIRRPAFIRNKHLIRLGAGFTSGVGLRLDAFDAGDGAVRIYIGEHVQVNDNVHIGAVRSVKIGNHVLIASKVFISDHNHGNYRDGGVQDSPDVPPEARPLSTAPIVIEDNVWIGEFVSVLQGVTIGRGAIIGSMSVVTKDVPPDSIAVGSPARVVKHYNRDTRMWERV
jgi:lipopolysaccharide O-acetyltransferase